MTVAVMRGAAVGRRLPARPAVLVSFSGFVHVPQEPAMQVNPYLVFNGNCEAAFARYREVLGGTLQAMMRHSDAPPGMPVADGWHDKIMHACLMLDDFALMGSDAPPQFQAPMQGFSVNLGLSSIAEAERIYAALSEGGEIRMALQQTFWADRFGMWTDRFGTPWMINCNVAAG
jgi:PhnB protein